MIKMGILYRQEDNGYKHVIEMKGENWKFERKDALYECQNFLMEKQIPFKIDYSFELFHVVIDRARVSFISGDNFRGTQDITDEQAFAWLKELIKWKTAGTRPSTKANIGG